MPYFLSAEKETHTHRETYTRTGRPMVQGLQWLQGVQRLIRVLGDLWFPGLRWLQGVQRLKRVMGHLWLQELRWLQGIQRLVRVLGDQWLQGVQRLILTLGWETYGCRGCLSIKGPDFDSVLHKVPYCVILKQFNQHFDKKI